MLVRVKSPVGKTFVWKGQRVRVPSRIFINDADFDSFKNFSKVTGIEFDILEKPKKNKQETQAQKDTNTAVTPPANQDQIDLNQLKKSELIDIAIEKGLGTEEELSKLKKSELIELLS